MTNFSCFIVPQQPQNTRMVVAPPPAIYPYVTISRCQEARMADYSRVLNSFTSSHTPAPSTAQPNI
ncbi:hypothetical protein DPMN_081136 [Dreissena polymorpha]|uniref:Uncharacterized protein n=1 Tax=Dreissena polymorpha TaxID=45954 RepID=A0A9D4B8Y3_DREPO|nr:hypothetical protein DPMN_081136 [Dreissena polymorpha]